MDRPLETILDELLVLRAQEGDVRALSALVNRWQRRLFCHALHLTERQDAAADVVQETWLTVVRGLGGLQDPACFRRWLFQIVTHRCADWIRSQQRQRKLTAHLEVETADQGCAKTPDDDIARLREGLRRLPSDRRALLSMSYLDGLSVVEIAEALSIPPGTVKSRLHHARQELKAIMERKQP